VSILVRQELRRNAMLKNCRAITTLPVTDFARARAFYRDKLGLTPTEPEGDLFECGAGTMFVMASMSAKPGGHTQMAFAVDDVRAEVDQLKARGVVFKDSEGNMISVGQRL